MAIQVEVHFCDIQQAIVEELQAASDSAMLLAYVFADRVLFEMLVSCQRRGVAVTLVTSDSDAHRHSCLAWERLCALGARVVRISDWSAKSDDLICLIDDEIVICGNSDSASIHAGLSQLSVMRQCDIKILSYYRHLFGIALGHSGNMEDPPAALDEPKHRHGLSIYQDPEIEELCLQVHMMQTKIMAVDAEIDEVLRQIHLFDYQQEEAIGDLMRRYLDLRRRYYRAKYRVQPEEMQRREAQAAEDVYRKYQESQDAKTDQDSPVQLDPLQQHELKQLYRKMAMQCHPDRVSEEDRGQANFLFQQLQLTFQNSDLPGLKQLKNKIEQGFGAKMDPLLKDPVDELGKQLKDLESTLSHKYQQLSEVIQTASWRELSSKPDWTEWFHQKATRLTAAMHHYMNELDVNSNGLRA